MQKRESLLLIGDVLQSDSKLRGMLGDLELKRAESMSSDQLVELLVNDQSIRGIVCPLSQKIDEGVLSLTPQLKIVSNIAVGLDNIDLDSARERGVRIAHTPNVLTEATADFAWALLLSGARRVVMGDRLVRSGQWKGWRMNQLLGRSIGGESSLSGKKLLGIIGLGRIGYAIAQRALGFSMDVFYYSRTRKVELEVSQGWRFAELNDLISRADYLVVCTPLTKDTRHLINGDRLKLMKRSAFLVNIGRGAVIDEEALIESLEMGHLSGAALDVYENEPSVPARLRSLPQVTLSPHLGSATIEARYEMCTQALLAAVATIRGEDTSDFCFAV